ncbi:DUF4855 domain-containing protein [Paenibacillus cellulositrophicus]|uniref:DUF4855 domain-containing protein n=1 Tax=Paenibacillus cellulositrophicus TaxID=562959 RepID=UPI003F80A395
MRKSKWIGMLIALLMFTAALPGKSEAAYVPPGGPGTGGLQDIVLIYSGYYNPANYGGEDISAWPQEQFKPYASFLDPNGNRKDTFFRDYLFLGLQGPNGRSFVRETDAAKAGLKSDWEWFLDRIFTSNNLQLRALNEETKAAGAAIGQPDMRNQVTIMVPFANENVTAFGDVDGDGVSENLTTLAGREKVTHWYISEVIRRFNEAHYSNLDLKGFYWLKEDLDTTKADEVSLVKDTAAYVHQQGDYKFFWIPWSKAYAATQWKTFGFDFAILQPNHFVNRSDTTSPETIKTSAAKSSNAGMGVEIEFDNQILRSDKYRERFYDYLNGGLEYGFMNGSVLGYYQDARGLYELYKQKDKGYSIYEDLYRFVKGTYVTDHEVSTLLNTFESTRFPSSASVQTSTATDIHVQGNASMKTDFGAYANSVLTGNYGADFAIKDWSAFDSFRIDAYNPSDTNGAVTVVIGDSSGNQHYAYAALYKKNWNTIRIPIADIVNDTGGSPQEPGTVPVNVRDIAYVKLVERNNANYPALPNTLYFDNMRLVEHNGVRLNDFEWLGGATSSSVTLATTKTTIREQNTALQADFNLYNVSMLTMSAGTNFKETDWSGEQALKVDIYNPNAGAMNLGVKLTDAAGHVYYKRIHLLPGQWNTAQINLADAAAGLNGTAEEGVSSAMDLSHMQKIEFYQRNNSSYAALPNRLFFDNVRLGKLQP